MPVKRIFMLAILILLTANHESKTAVISDITIGGRLQPRYEYTLNHGSESDLSSFYIRRARLDVRGNLFDNQVSFRIMPELARQATMRDAWLNYRLSSYFQLRAGQMPVPFHWHRAVSSTSQHFAERSDPSLNLGFPDGYDIGLMLHGQSDNQRAAYRVGIFDGSGRNTKFSNSSGHMVSTRLSYAVLGKLPVSESAIYRSSSPSLALGSGLQAANKNESRNWDLGRSVDFNHQADYLSLTGDIYFSIQGFSLATEVFKRYVEPNDQDVDAYESIGYMLSAGFTIIPARLEIVGRYSEMEVDTKDPHTLRTEWAAGFNIYHREHLSKTRIQYLQSESYSAADIKTTGSFIVEHHIQF